MIIHIGRHGGINTDPSRPHDRISVQAIHDGFPMREPVVTMSGYLYRAVGTDPFLRLTPRDAEELARLIIMLATATPAQHEELAAMLRASAAVVRGTAADQ